MTVPLPIPTEPTKAPPCPRGVGFVTLAEAHTRSGWPMPTLARRCRQQWAQENLAMVMPPAGGGKPCWHVREDADPALGRVKSPEALPFDWGKITEAQRQSLHRKKAMLDAWADALAELVGELGWTEGAATAQFVEQQDGISARTLYNWRRDFRHAGWAGLLDKRRDREAEPAGTEFLEYLKQKYLDPRKRGAALCYTLAVEKAEEQGWPVPFSLRRAQQILAGLDKKVVEFHREGGRKYDGTCGRYIVRDYTALASNELWESDGHTFNVFVVHDGKPIRPTLVSWLDIRSRYCVGHRIVAGSENSDVILSAFRRGVEACGLPAGVHIDNGKAYRAGSLQQIDVGVFDRLEVKVRFARAYNAKSKLIERWHRTIDERFSKRFDSYCGGDTASKPFDLEKHKANAPTLEEFAAAFEAWLEADYHNRNHYGADMDGKTPAQVYCENLHEKRAVSPDLLALELCRRESATVGRNGVTIRGITYEAPELDSRAGQELTVLIDNATVGRVKVLDEQGRFLCEATSIRCVPANATPEQLRDAIAGVKRDRKRVKAAAQAQMRMADDPIERLHRQAEAKRAKAPKPTPQTSKPLRSKLEDDLPAIREAERDRQASANDAPMHITDLYEQAAGGGDRGGVKYPTFEELFGSKAVNE